MTRRKELVVFCSALTAGGAERVLSILAVPFADHFDSVRYVMWKEAPVFYDIDPRVELVCVERECGSREALAKLLWLRRYVKRLQPSLVLSFSAPYNMLALAALLGSGTKTVVAERIDPRSFRWGRVLEWCRKLLYRTAAGVLAQTEYSKEYFTGTLRDKTTVIYNPVTMDPSHVGRALRAEKQPVVVSAARLVPQKRQTLLIDVFARFAEQHPDYRLVIYGEGVERENLMRHAAERGVAERVVLPGTVKNLWDCIASARMFVMTSLFEGMSNSMIEAMCLGLPCISTKVSGATDLIRDGHNGYLVDIDDAEELYRKMELLADEQTASRIGAEATKVYESLKVETISRVWTEYLDSVIDKKR
ncbi:MAG: glycosyltransferase [Tidjanibacter sp.]|nr:glycosyltransferase [Tidjanibacter sp.]